MCTDADSCRHRPGPQLLWSALKPCLVSVGAVVQLNLWVRGFKEGTVDDALAAFKVRSSNPSTPLCVPIRLTCYRRRVHLMRRCAQARCPT